MCFFFSCGGFRAGGRPSPFGTQDMFFFLNAQAFLAYIFLGLVELLATLLLSIIKLDLSVTKMVVSTHAWSENLGGCLVQVYTDVEVKLWRTTCCFWMLDMCRVVAATVAF